MSNDIFNGMLSRYQIRSKDDLHSNRNGDAVSWNDVLSDN